MSLNDKLLEHVLKKKFYFLFEELKTERHDKITEVFDKLDKLLSVLSQSNEEILVENEKLKKDNDNLTKAVDDLTKKSGLMLTDMKNLADKNKSLETKNAVLVDQVRAFQGILVDAATSKNERIELAFEGLKSKYESLHSEKKDADKTIELIGGVIENVGKQNQILKSKLNLKGKIISNDNDAQSVSKQEKVAANEKGLAK